MTRQVDLRREIVERLGDERVNDTLVDLMWDAHVAARALREITEVRRAKHARRIAQRALDELDGLCTG